MLRLKSKENLPEQVYDAVEDRYAKLLGQKRKWRAGLYRKVVYFVALTGCHPYDVIVPPYPILTKERHRLKNDVLDFVIARVHVSDRHGHRCEKVLQIPVFLDFRVDKKDKEQVFFEEEMWDVITDNWPYDEVKLDFKQLGRYVAAKQALWEFLRGVKLRCYGPLDKMVDKPVSFTDLRMMRLYDLLHNRREYGINTDVVWRIMGFEGPEWMSKSKVAREAFQGESVISLLKSY